jgi:hypothetical protein
MQLQQQHPQQQHQQQCATVPTTNRQGLKAPSGAEEMQRLTREYQDEGERPAGVSSCCLTRCSCCKATLNPHLLLLSCSCSCPLGRDPGAVWHPAAVPQLGGPAQPQAAGAAGVRAARDADNPAGAAGRVVPAAGQAGQGSHAAGEGCWEQAPCQHTVSGPC